MKYWFKRRRYGYGWMPASPAGWVAIGVYLVVVISAALVLLEDEPNTSTSDLLLYLVIFAAATIVFVITSYRKGPTPKWRWGKSPDDNPEEDW